jgi:hypothetical protein
VTEKALAAANVAITDLVAANLILAKLALEDAVK